MTAYYNENDAFAAAWLRELIKAGHIAPGEVDERSIEDVVPNELAGFTQCHFFAGIGVWSYALRRSGWPDDRPIWTGSCPCQPFSAAGKGDGFTDERHLWPHWLHLIIHGKPSDTPVMGEQVANKGGLAWLDLVQTDMEGTGDAFRAIDLCAAGFGSPNIRQRAFWMADPNGTSPARQRELSGQGAPQERLWDGLANSRQSDQLANTASVGRNSRPGPRNREQTEQWGKIIANSRQSDRLGDAICKGLERHSRNEDGKTRRPIKDRSTSETGGNSRMVNTSGEPSERNTRGISGKEREIDFQGFENGNDGHRYTDASETGGMANTDGRNTGPERQQPGGQYRQQSQDTGIGNIDRPANPTNGFWSDVDWLGCRDGKFRPVEPDTFPLVNGAPVRVGRLRGYGNAINAEAAQAFIETVMIDLPEWRAA